MVILGNDHRRLLSSFEITVTKQTQKFDRKRIKKTFEQYFTLFKIAF